MACDVTHTQKTTFYNSMGWKSFQTHGILTDDCQAHETVKIERGGWKKERGETNMEKRTEAQIQIGMLRVKHGHYLSTSLWRDLPKNMILSSFTHSHVIPKHMTFVLLQDKKEDVMSLVSIQWKLMVTRVSLICAYFSPDSDNTTF